MEAESEYTKFFKDITSNCSRIRRRFFYKGETITTYIEKRNQLCILLSGEADLIRYDYNGNKTIIGHFSDNSIFGEALYPANTNNELFVLAKSDCTILFISYNDILKKCKSNCTFHKDLSDKVYALIMEQIVTLNTRIELLTKKSTRDKILSYFDFLSNKSLSKTFTLPFSLTDLADYLSVDRSAMMREISYLKEEGFIKKNGKKITLLY